MANTILLVALFVSGLFLPIIIRLALNTLALWLLFKYGFKIQQTRFWTLVVILLVGGSLGGLFERPYWWLGALVFLLVVGVGFNNFYKKSGIKKHQIAIALICLLIISVLTSVFPLIPALFRLTGKFSGTGSTAITSTVMKEKFDQTMENYNNPNFDFDNDGLINADEIKYGTSRTNPDTDGDGLTDGEEVHLSHTNPVISDITDTDNDGLNDYEEIRIYHTNPNKADTDEDGYSDGAEVMSGHDPLTPAVPKK